MALFIDRAQALRADFVPTDRDATLLVQLVNQLDGLPLAIELAEQAAPELRGSRQREAFLHLARELDNLRLALRCLLDRHDQETALRLVIALGWFWFARGHHQEGWRWLEETLAMAQEADPFLRARALARAGLILNYLGDLDRAQRLLRQAEFLALASPDPCDLSEVRTYLGARDVLAGNGAAGVTRLADQLEDWRRLGDGRAAFHLGYSLSNLAAAAIGRGEVGEAASLLTEGVAWHESRGDGRSAAVVRCRLAVVLAELGERARALQLVEEGLASGIVLQDRLLLSVGVEAALIVVKDDANIRDRERLLGGADALSQATGLAFGILGRSLHRDVSALRDLLQRTELDAAYREGRTLSFDQLAGRTLELLSESSRTVPGPEQGARAPVLASLLSTREQEVLRLVAEGLTSREIGKRLFLSPRTIEHHLTSVFNKLGVDTRAQAVAVATRDGLV